MKLDSDVLAVIRQASPALANRFEAMSECAKRLKNFITNDPKMLRMKQDAQKISNEEDSVLIVGPTGTGKEIIAKALHGDRTGAFIALNCAGLPDTLVESELFGHAKAAFTGALADKKGLCSAAENGTLFLDEIGELPLSVQPKLLRAIQEKRVRRVGGEVDITINCRFVSATHRNLIDMCDEGKFREDLYHRISMFELYTSPLEERIGDIPLLIEALDSSSKIPDIEEFCAGINPRELRGNVRTLERLVRRFHVLGTKPQHYTIG